MNKEYRKLELDKVLELLSNEAWSDDCRANIKQLQPFYEADRIRLEIKKTDDAFVMSSKFGTPRFSRIHNICDSAKRAQSGSSLSLRELLNICDVLREIQSLVSWHQQCENQENSLSELFSVLVPNKHLQEQINNAIISEEELSDSASPELGRLRRSIARQGMVIRDQLDRIVRSQSKYLQESIITQRDGRFVVPVKTEYKGEVSGLVHDTSSSGATLFIEPMSVVEANNEIRVLRGKEQAEIERIIYDLSMQVGDFSLSLIHGYETAIELELYFAKANLGAKMKATTPVVVDEPLLFLNKARHPLINKDDVVPTTISLGETYSCLIVTGPNTGGKTVAIKTAGLLTLMTMCGMMIPVSDGSRVGVFSRIHADIGDEQSIEQSLSTFSSHMNNIISIMKSADERSLVLLDELGSGTDPIEGAALAVSVLTWLKDNGCKVIATTHYQEVKLFAIETDGVENACCEFDVKTLKPTYKLIVGVPGKSNAFAIVKRLGMEDGIIDYARELVSTENKRFEQVVEQLEKSRQELEALKESIAVEERRTKELTEQLARQSEEAEKQKEIEMAAARQKALSIIEETRFNADLLMEELEKLKKEKDKADFSEKVKGSRSHINTFLNKMYDEADPVVEAKQSKYKLPRPLKPYDNVLLSDIGKKGTLITMPDASGVCYVQVGLIKTKTTVGNLRLCDKEEKPKPPIKSSIKKSVQSNMTRQSSMELDIRGMASDEGVMEADKFIDNCVLSGIKMITIIHGKGTGVLRDAVQRYLRRNSNVKTFRTGVYGEGESGVTIVELK